MSAPDEAPYRLYTNAQGARRINSAVIKASTLARLARKGVVPCTRNGRKVAWTSEQLAGVVAYLARPTQPKPKPKKPERTPSAAPAPTSSRPARTAQRGEITPLVAVPGRRYGRTA
ncbi:hypothetical protein GCM10017673_39960 [Streptosporangium violaceochromogenes]|nr:hypothetical protein GCM10017673_39960 [Streptosporangium violaceochromogenes]